MWVLFAFGSALFAGLTSILAKCGIRQTDSNVATAIRTCVVLVFSWVMVAIVGSADTIGQISPKTWLFLILSGLATGASWLCYFHALQIGEVNKVVPVDKSSTILTIILAFIFLGEPITPVKAIAVVLIGAGTYLMIQRKAEGAGAADSVSRAHGNSWLLFAAGSAVFAALTAILGKVGIEGVESNLGTAIRTCVVLVMAWVVVAVTGKTSSVRDVPRDELGFICLSGLATGASWLCYYRALQDGLASVVVPIDKLSILVTIAFSYVVFHERLNRRSGIGLALIVGGTLAMLIP
jgi:transporter family protein